MRPSKLASLCVLLSSGIAPLAHADDARSPSEIQASVEKNFIEPLQRYQDHRSKFSRVMMPPMERRVRVTDPALHRDARGQDFAVFAMDTRYYDERWSRDALVGCVYPSTGEVFVKMNDAYMAGKRLFGKKTESAPDGVCRSTDTRTATVVQPQAVQQKKM